MPAASTLANRSTRSAASNGSAAADPSSCVARGQGISSSEDLDLAGIVDEVSESLSERAATTGVAVQLDLRPSTVLGDPTMIAQAVSNLLDNAIRHNVDGGRIWISVRAEGSDSTLLVENSGPVIDPDVVALLCEPFYRAGASRTAGSRTGAGIGVGLGLSIVSSINQARHGDLEITARDGGGLTVRWRLTGSPAGARRG